MLRERLNERLKSAMKDKDARAVSTLRLILTAIKDRDIAARGKGESEGIAEPEILQVLQTMIRQRQDAIKLYEQGGRLELAEQEAEEISIIEGFLPEQLDDAGRPERDSRSRLGSGGKEYKRHGEGDGRVAQALCRADGLRQSQRHLERTAQRALRPPPQWRRCGGRGPPANRW